MQPTAMPMSLEGGGGGGGGGERGGRGVGGGMYVVHALCLSLWALPWLCLWAVKKPHQFNWRRNLDIMCVVLLNAQGRLLAAFSRCGLVYEVQVLEAGTRRGDVVTGRPAVRPSGRRPPSDPTSPAQPP